MSQETLPLPKSSALEARKGEGLLIVQQNNQDRTLIISEMNETLEAMLGFARGEAIGRSLEMILGNDLQLALFDDLEFAEDAPDFGDIFSRIREIKLKRRLGDEIRVECTLSRLLPEPNAACFQLVIPNEHERVAATKLRDFLALNLEGRKEVDVATGLPNAATAKAFSPLLGHYLAESKMQVVFAVLRLDRFEKSIARYGEDACRQLLIHAASCCRATFRADDMIFALSDRTLGVILFDISRESARVVFNRLRWRIRNHRIAFGGKADFSITTCIGFDALVDDAVEEMFGRCEKAIADLDVGERNALVELNAA